jgi:hypothetical protein
MNISPSGIVDDDDDYLIRRKISAYDVDRNYGKSKTITPTFSSQ